MISEQNEHIKGPMYRLTLKNLGKIGESDGRSIFFFPRPVAGTAVVGSPGVSQMQSSF